MSQVFPSALKKSNGLCAAFFQKNAYTTCMKIVFTGGGTAGHVMPNIALINSLPDTAQAYYFGCDGMEKTLITRNTDAVFVPIKAAKFKRSLSPSNLLLPFRLADSVVKTKKLLSDVSPDVVFAKGGYVSLPVVLAARKLSIPVVLHESDTTIGLANKLCARHAYALLSSFDLASPPGSVTVGCPVRREIYSANPEKGLSFMRFDGKKPVLLFLGGSQGALTLNNLASSVDTRLHRKFDIFVICGKNKKITETPTLHAAEFCDNIFDVVSACSFCITRGGANTLCELCVLNRPFAVIPLTSSSRGEQTSNAGYFADRGCGALLNPDISPDSLADAVTSLYPKTPLFKHAQKRLKIDGTDATLDYIFRAASSRSDSARRR